MPYTSSYSFWLDCYTNSPFELHTSDTWFLSGGWRWYRCFWDLRMHMFLLLCILLPFRVSSFLSAYLANSEVRCVESEVGHACRLLLSARWLLVKVNIFHAAVGQWWISCKVTAYIYIPIWLWVLLHWYLLQFPHAALIALARSSSLPEADHSSGCFNCSKWLLQIFWWSLQLRYSLHLLVDNFSSLSLPQAAPSTCSSSWAFLVQEFEVRSPTQAAHSLA